jgi:ABC-2 type transport system ATP-binding protein
LNALEATHISKSYANHQALRNVSVAIPKQSIYGLLGPNGAGKTTLLRIINQIIAADQGEILINNQRLNPTHIRQIGYLPEERGLYKKMKVTEQLLYLARLKGLSTHEAVTRIKKWFHRLEITGWEQKRIEDLSKGMQQKIQFIATVVHEPDLIILDEPFSGFDPVNANLIKAEIRALQERGKTIIFSTHRMESVEELCSHIAMINKSEKVVEGPKNEIKSQYKSNAYCVLHKQNVEVLPDEFSIVSTVLLEDGTFETIIKLDNGESPDRVLQEFIARKAEVHGFRELLPSINDIFITLVKGQ